MYTVALLLVLAPSIPTDMQFTDDPALYQTVKDVAQLCDLYENGGNWGAFGSELDWVRRHYRGCRNLPPSADACWLPSREFCEAAVRFSDASLDWMRTRKGIGRDVFDDCIEQTQQLNAIWELARKIRRDRPNLAQMRMHLYNLRELIGHDAYRAGQMPPWVAHWFFDEVQ